MRVTIEKLVHGGSGIASCEGKRVFVPYSAPGDILEVEIVSEHAGFSEARILSVLEPSPCRVAPRCPVFGSCGGCQWQHISYEAQLEWKRRILVEQLKRTGKIASPDVGETLPSPRQWGWRNRMQLHVDSRGRVGYYRRRSKEVVEFEECAIAEEELNLRLNSERGDFAKRDRGVALKLGGAAGFSQVNTLQNQNLQKLVAEWLSGVEHECVLELHAGSGNFTFELARVAGRVIATEIDGRAVREALDEQARLGVCNVQIRRLEAASAVERFSAEADAVLLDPPRRGAPEVIGALASRGPASLLYISCDPATLARDLRELCAAGYGFVRAKPVDMFPQTHHVECLALLERR